MGGRDLVHILMVPRDLGSNPRGGKKTHQAKEVKQRQIKIAKIVIFFGGK